MAMPALTAATAAERGGDEILRARRSRLSPNAWRQGSPVVRDSTQAPTATAFDAARAPARSASSGTTSARPAARACTPAATANRMTRSEFAGVRPGGGTSVLETGGHRRGAATAADEMGFAWSTSSASPQPRTMRWSSRVSCEGTSTNRQRGRHRREDAGRPLGAMDLARGSELPPQLHGEAGERQVAGTERRRARPDPRRSPCRSPSPKTTGRSPPPPADFLAKRDARGAARAPARGARRAAAARSGTTSSTSGWLGLHVPEEHGGSGYGLEELVVVVEELGRAVAPGPVRADGDRQRRARRGRRRRRQGHAPARPGRRLGRRRGRPRRRRSPSTRRHAHRARPASCSAAASPSVLLVAGRRRRRRRRGRATASPSTTPPNLDPTRRSARVTLDGAPATVAARAPARCSSTSPA